MADQDAPADTTGDSSRLNGVQQFFLLAFGLFGCLVVWGATTEFVDDVRLRLFGRETVGVVVEHEWSSSTTMTRGLSGPGSTITFSPIVAIDTPDGKAKIRGKVFRALTDVAPIGTKVGVLYLVGRPADGAIKSEVDLAWISILTGLLGFAMVAAVVAVMVATGTWKLPRRSPLRGSP